MGLIISYSKLAQHDLREIYNYIRRGSLKYAHLEVKLIRDAIARLKINPFLGKKFEETDDKSSRELIFRNYRIIYDITSEKMINILTIHHHARLVANNPAFGGDDEDPA